MNSTGEMHTFAKNRYERRRTRTHNALVSSFLDCVAREQRLPVLKEVTEGADVGAGTIFLHFGRGVNPESTSTINDLAIFATGLVLKQHIDESAPVKVADLTRSIYRNYDTNPQLMSGIARTALWYGTEGMPTLLADRMLLPVAMLCTAGEFAPGGVLDDNQALDIRRAGLEAISDIDLAVSR